MNIQPNLELPLNWPSLMRASEVMGPKYYQGRRIATEEGKEGQLERALRREMLLEELQQRDYHSTAPVRISGVDIIGTVLDLYF